MSDHLTPSKRPHEDESDGNEKLPKLAVNHSPNQSSNSSSCGLFRVLCPVSKVGDNLEKAISRVCEETGIKIRVQEAVSGCDERVVVIGGSDGEPDVNVKKSKEDGDEEANVAEEDENKKGDGEGNEDEESARVNDTKSENSFSGLNKALLLVFEIIIEAEKEKEVVEEENNKSSKSVLRLLVLSSQVGCILGKGGSVIKQMSAQSGAEIRVLPRDKIPICASATDEVVQIMGDIDAVRKALEFVSEQLSGNQSRDHDFLTANFAGPSHTPPNHSSKSQAAPSATGRRDVPHFGSSIPTSVPKFHESGIPARQRPSKENLTFRLLCHDDKVGGVIGKGGAVIRILKQETGCDIKVLEAVPDSEDRLIIVSGPVHPNDRISPPQDAVLRVHARIFRAMPDNREPTVVARILVSSNQIGCLLGKGGSIIAEMRKLTGAYIRIMGKDQIPKIAAEGEEVVQINGDVEAVQEALLQITTRLRHHFLRDAFPSINLPLDPGFLEPVPPYPSFRGRREFSPPGVYSDFGPSFNKFDPTIGPPPHGGFPREFNSFFMHHDHRPGMPPHISERKPWGPQGLVEGGGSIGLADFAGPPHRRVPGFGGGSHPAVITSTTVEVVVPHSVVPVIRGEDGFCLKQIRQISDAKITITDSKPGAVETGIIISGTPEQTHAAQSLIQAFVISEKEST